MIDMENTAAEGTGRDPHALVGAGFIMEAWPTHVVDGKPVVRGFLRTTGPGGNLIRFICEKQGLAVLNALATYDEIRFAGLIEHGRLDIRSFRSMQAPAEPSQEPRTAIMKQ